MCVGVCLDCKWFSLIDPIGLDLCFRWNSCICIKFFTFQPEKFHRPEVMHITLREVEFGLKCTCFIWNGWSFFGLCVSVDIVVEGFEYLSNAAKQLLLLKKWLYIWNSNNCNQVRKGLLPWIGNNLLISFEIELLGMGIVFLFFHLVAISSGYSYVTWNICDWV